tara:strand:+ start:915 stop:2351 length:1437 start_codon:yes stop_codon:yes gene_type:complete
MGGLVAVFIATVAIFSERSVTVFVENQSVSSEEEGSSEPVKDESVIDQKSDPVSETGEASEKIEDDVKSQEAEVITEKSTDKAASEEKVTIYPPKLETVRIDDDGTALVAGMAYPGSILEILVDEEVVESITLGQDGNFAVLFDIELKDRPQVISIRSIDGETVLVSDETMIVAPKIIELAQADPADNQTQKQSEGAENSTEVGVSPKEKSETTSEENSSSDLAAETDLEEETEKAAEANNISNDNVDKADLTNKTPQLAQPTEEKIEEDVQQILTQEPSDSDLIPNTVSNKAEQPTVLLADSEGVKVVQSGKTGPNVMTDVMFDTINYSKDGDVAVTGRGTPESIVHFYLDNSPVASTAVDQTGYWSADLSDVEAGVYTLRLDQLDQSGKVSSRIESPFKREDRSVLVDQMQDIASPARINVITVQPGNTLWAISRERYGRGILYVQVFDANKDKIRDPDLIYPGQIFDLPDSITVN